jgi:hypothetical protein
MSTLENKFILNTYQGVLHSDGELVTSGASKLYDGLGNASALSLGRDGNGGTINGNLSASSLTVGDLTYPSISGNANDVVMQNENGDLILSDTLPSSILADLNPNPANTYDGGIKSIKVNSKGLTTEVKSWGSSDYTITATTYKSNAGSPFSIVPVTTEWTKVFLTDAIPASDVASVKSVILYMEPDPRLANNRTNYKILTSPNQSDIIPAFYVAGGEDAGGGSDTYGVGAQFSTLVGGSGTSSIFFYVKSGGTDTQTYTFNIHLIAYQR